MIEYPAEFFDAKATLECGQVFRFTPSDDGFTLISDDKACFLSTRGDKTEIITDDENYFSEYFDLKRDYGKIYSRVLSFNEDFLSIAAKSAKGVRILKQNLFETCASFIISQNNNIARIKKIIENLSEKCGKPFVFRGKSHYSFPTPENLANLSLSELKEAGLGYRCEYLKGFSEKVAGGFDLHSLNLLSTPLLTKELLKIKGIGKKVADCITFFGYGRSDSFPVDTWIEKLYRENLGGKETNREKISLELVSRYGEFSGFCQQYLFYYKRSLEKLPHSNNNIYKI